MDGARRTGRIAVAMSGGVDSSVAALLLRRAGHDVVGFFLKNGVTAAGSGAARSCCSASDAADARLVADRIGVPFYSLDVREPFARLIDGFVAAYRRGETPNPCVRCNVDVKFGHLLDLARSVGAERVATGHYARIRGERGRFVLGRGGDRDKDQSYVLATLSQEQLGRACFPLGDLDKRAVRDLARAAELPVADKPESQEICFVPSGDYRDLLRARGETAEPGEIVTVEGETVARHDGVAGFTVGQRKGLNVALGAPRHVVRLEPSRQRVVIGTREQASRRTFRAAGANWVALAEPAAGSTFRGTARVRHRHEGAPATVTVAEEGAFDVTFDAPEFAVAPGQAAVVYVGDDVLVAGTIAAAVGETS